MRSDEPSGAGTDVFARLCPAAPGWTLDWDAAVRALPWLRTLEGVPQDAEHHAEGDVAVHTRMAAEALAALPEWRARPVEERVRLFATVLLHDAAKPETTRADPVTGRLTAHGHSARGELTARRVLWRLGAPSAWREHVAALVRHHQVPFWALERPTADLRAIAYRCSLLAGNRDLATLARADITGRICGDLDAVLENIALFEEWCATEGCLDGPRAFAGDHARFAWFRHPERDPSWAAHDDTRLTVTVMSGLPGSGKDTWVARNRPGVPVVSLDALRAELGVAPTDDQRPVAAAAFARARELLRAGTDFVWNATNTTRRIRGQCTGLAADYGARVEMVALEAPRAALVARNAARDRGAVPVAVLDRLAAKWEPPDLTEAHTVTHVATA
ncbi:poly(A) polymerase [Mangrovactinospora gilvigrisea]|uniref:Poly(A) polymerase n=1 Tax=Mangrovactinospora gilvigrisea TaxID=1428644 RepID=A0A1J7BS89_9ACTN|nr:AAA family ATPase [Mangrovactinospora gilvigrisea]OIV36329.1 poly(A) polymerase [Mangrovactinospora gilvigrisea]